MYSKLRFLRDILQCTPMQFRHCNKRGTCLNAVLTRTTPTTVFDQPSHLESSVVPTSFPLRSSISRPLKREPVLAYDVLKGPLVSTRGCSVLTKGEVQVQQVQVEDQGVSTPTIVLVHGILGSKKNLRAFARRLLESCPTWQAILVDLRCHGESYLRTQQHPVSTHNVQSAAKDILQLLNSLKIFPRVLIGHSFGGKVIMSMAQQFGKALPRPVQAWVLDALPGEVRNDDSSGQDHPYYLIKTLQSIPLPIKSRNDLINELISKGFSRSIATWMTTNLVPMDSSNSTQNGFRWSVDLAGIEQLYKSYEMECLWSFLKSPPEGLKVDFVRAEHSQFRWGGTDEDVIHSYGHQVHFLEDSGHWVHTDNPSGLLQIMRHSLRIKDSCLPRSASL